MVKTDILYQVYYWRNRLRAMFCLPYSSRPYLNHLTIKQLLHLRGCICAKIIKIQNRGKA